MPVETCLKKDSPYPFRIKKSKIQNKVQDNEKSNDKVNELDQKDNLNNDGD